MGWAIKKPKIGNMVKQAGMWLTQGARIATTNALERKAKTFPGGTLTFPPTISEKECEDLLTKYSKP